MEPAIDTPATSTTARDHLPGSPDLDEPPAPSITQERGVGIQCSPLVRRALDLTWLSSRLEAGLQHISRITGRSVHRVAVLIVADSEIVELHRRHSGHDQTTDVLTFDLSGSGSGPIDADIAINVDEAARQSTQRGHSPQRELLLYALHGILHCAGFDDHDEAGYRSMHQAEDRILQAIGVGATFDSTNNDTAVGGTGVSPVRPSHAQGATQ
ncbi:MAG: rRNA maturation RNase YbeY [Phycisphaerales bacterium]|nr:rRNA maturation RNase YbeY [Phycisphaerales bacterium]MCI0630788.1 rRNA maturation RNase YbeY [Phycisphaerales bacterium]MCI0674212.1 rRNA maturation RNase YbeY [Phycisphaerales bacterium]